MSQPEPSGSGVPSAERRRTINERDQLAIKAAPAALNQEQTAAILKLDIDCFEEAFDYMPSEDLVSVSETCKRLQQVAGYCFQQNYLGRAFFNSHGIHIENRDAPHLFPFVQKIGIYGDGFRYFFDARSKFQRLKQISIFGIPKSTDCDINRLKECSLGKLEVLSVSHCDLGNNFHEIIDQCPKLRLLKVFLCDGEYNWFDRKYPKLEYFEIVPSSLESIGGIPMFLKLNPNIRKFAINFRLFWDDRDKMMTTNIELDELVIEMGGFLHENFLNLLNTLYERGVYRILHLSFIFVEIQEQLNRLASVGGLVKLNFISSSNGPLRFSALKNLEELYVKESRDVADLEMLPNNLVNLKQIHFERASFDDIMPFIRRSINMHRIKIDEPDSGAYFNKDTGVINLLALNREREQLPDADKVTLYVREEIYLATKWAFGETDFGLIRLRRDTVLQ